VKTSRAGVMEGRFGVCNRFPRRREFPHAASVFCDTLSSVSELGLLAERGKNLLVDPHAPPTKRARTGGRRVTGDEPMDLQGSAAIP
jgi:hypothetical protein